MAHPIGAYADKGSSWDPLTRAGHACVLLAVPLVTFNALRVPGNLTFGDPLLLLGGLLLGLAWLRHGHPSGAVPVAIPVGVALMLAAGLLAILATGNWSALDPTLRFIVPISAMPLVMMVAGATPRWSHRLVDAWLLGATANAAVGILDRLGATSIGASLASFDYAALQDRATGLTNHPNHFGLVMAMALPMVISRLSAGGHRGSLAFVALPMVAGGLAASGSRGALLAAVGGVILYLLLATRSTRSRAGFAMLAAMTATVALLAFAPGDTRNLGVVTAERFAGQRNVADSDSERRALLRKAIDDARERPFIGSGYSSARPAHDIYLQFIQGGGMIALAGFLLFAGTILLLARSLARGATAVPYGLSALAAAGGASAGVWLLFGIVGPNTYDRYLYLPVGLVLALSLVRARSASTAPRLTVPRQAQAADPGAAAPPGSRPTASLTR